VKKLTYYLVALIPPLLHLIHLPSFLKDKSVSKMTKLSVIVENIGLYTLAGILFAVFHIGFAKISAIIIGSLLLMPAEWFLIEKSKLKIANWNRFKSQTSFYLLQYQLTGYIVAGYLIGHISMHLLVL